MSAAGSRNSVRVGDSNQNCGNTNGSFNEETGGDTYNQKAHNMMGAGKGARFDKIVFNSGGAGSGSEN